MTFNTRRPVLPMLPMPPRNSSLDMPPFAFAPSSSGTSTPCYSEGLSLPHTPLPGTPLTLQFEKAWPTSSMITPTPTHNQPFTFDFHAACLPRTDSTQTLSATNNAHDERTGAGRWSVDSGIVEDDDGLPWDDREEGILLSFLDNPLHPLATPYPPGTLPPSSALDEITTQIIRFHSPPTPVGPTIPLKSPALGLSSSVSAPSLSSSSARKSGKHHRRTHSASGIPWCHSWKATRKKLYEIARQEALGATREDRFKGRVIASPPVEEDEMEGYMSPMGHSTPMPSTESHSRLLEGEVTDTPSGRILRRPGGVLLQRHGSETMLEFPQVELGLPLDGEIKVGAALRLSSTLQRSTTAPSETRSVRSTGMQRKPSLLQRGQSFTADDFNTCLSLSSDPASDDDLALHDQECATPSAVFDNQTPTLQTVHHLDTSTPQAQECGQDLFGDMFGRHNDLASPPSSIFGSDPCDITLDNDVIPATPDHVHVPSIMLTKTSPTPMIHLRNGSGSSDFEIVSPARLKQLSGLGTPLNLSPPGSPKPQFAPGFPTDQDKTPRPAAGLRPGLIRARSSTAAHKTPSAFCQFMNNTPAVPNAIDSPPVEPSFRSLNLGLALPSAKRQKLGAGLTIPLPGASLDAGLASPFDEKKVLQ
ncbi:hypothetical protein NCC49_002689 [Naganishia albida]|nr:hypothetical protein NCC49_002689 [Naganishia albida]